MWPVANDTLYEDQAFVWFLRGVPMDFFVTMFLILFITNIGRSLRVAAHAM